MDTLTNIEQGFHLVHQLNIKYSYILFRDRYIGLINTNLLTIVGKKACESLKPDELGWCLTVTLHLSNFECWSHNTLT